MLLLQTFCGGFLCVAFIKRQQLLDGHQILIQYPEELPDDGRYYLTQGIRVDKDFSQNIIGAVLSQIQERLT